jgi:hypothetical protein
VSDPTKCEHCRTVGPRRIMRRAPDGWFYFEAKDDHDTENTIMVCVCSKACADALWMPGPGPRWTAEELKLTALPELTAAQLEETEHQSPPAPPAPAPGEVTREQYEAAFDALNRVCVPVPSQVRAVTFAIAAAEARGRAESQAELERVRGELAEANRQAASCLEASYANRDALDALQSQPNEYGPAPGVSRELAADVETMESFIRTSPCATEAFARITAALAARGAK